MQSALALDSFKPINHISPTIDNFNELLELGNLKFQKYHTNHSLPKCQVVNQSFLNEH